MKFNIDDIVTWNLTGLTYRIIATKLIPRQRINMSALCVNEDSDYIITEIRNERNKEDFINACQASEIDLELIDGNG